MAARTCPAELRALPDRHQPAANLSTARLRHIMHQMRRTAQHISEAGSVVGRQAHVKISSRPDIDMVMPQE